MHRVLLVVGGEGRLEGIATIQDIERALLDNKPGATLAEVGSRPVQTAFPDESLGDAISRMGARDLAQLAVVSRSNPQEVVGLLRRVDVIRAYSKSMLHRLEEGRQRPVRLPELRGTQFVEVTVEPGSPLAGRRLSELKLPTDALVVLVEREREAFVPRGNTRLLPGDRLLIHVHDDAVASLHEQLAGTSDGKKSDRDVA